LQQVLLLALLILQFILQVLSQAQLVLSHFPIQALPSGQPHVGVVTCSVVVLSVGSSAGLLLQEVIPKAKATVTKAVKITFFINLIKIDY
jgi:hypothetical protein